MFDVHDRLNEGLVIKEKSEYEIKDKENETRIVIKIRNVRMSQGNEIKKEWDDVKYYQWLNRKLGYGAPFAQPRRVVHCNKLIAYTD